MTTDSERCVDDLLRRLTNVDNFLVDLESKTSDEKLMLEAREQLTSTQSFIDNNQALIPGYCLKKALDSLKKLENFVNKSHESKMQFKFKPSASSPSRPKAPPSEPIDKQPESKPYTHTMQGDTSGFSRRNGESLELNPSEVDSKDITLSDLENCNVVIRGMANTVYISNLKNTSVSVGIACRAITVKECRNCIFKLVCQQLRIDSTFDSKFEIYTSARSMLENSNGLEFRRLHLDSGLIESMQKCSMDSNSNNWKCIDDFDWLSPNAPSQHYKLVELADDDNNN